MSQSPYDPPNFQSFQTTGSPGNSRDKLRRVAKYQRWVLFALLANISANVLSFATVGQELPIRLVAIAIGLGVALLAVASIFLLAKELINTGIAVLCGILMFIPCISLITLLVINQKATAFLQAGGIKVGFMGVNPDSI